MSSRTLVVFCDAGDVEALCRSVESFIDLNATEIGRFKLVISLYRPDYDTVEIVKSRFLSKTHYIIADSKPVCVPCVMNRHRVRYAIVIPGVYTSHAPLWPYLKEFTTVLSAYPSLSHIQLVPDISARNHSTGRPLVYLRHTRHVLIGNGNKPSTKHPVLLRASNPQPNALTGALSVDVFREDTQ